MDHARTFKKHNIFTHRVLVYSVFIRALVTSLVHLLVWACSHRMIFIANHARS